MTALAIAAVLVAWQAIPFRSSSASGQSPPLVALFVEQAGWPMSSGGCDGFTRVAGFRGQPNPSTYNGDSYGYDARVAIMKAGGAAWEQGVLALSLTARKGYRVSVVGIDVITFKHSATQATWVMAPNELDFACEDASDEDNDGARYGINFDGVHPSVFAIPHSGGPENRKFGKPFTVSAKDAVPIEIWTADCHNYVEWGLRINYVVTGEEGIKTLAVNDSAYPYRSVGGNPPAYVNKGTGYAIKLTRDADSDRVCDARVSEHEHN